MRRLRVVGLIFLFIARVTAVPWPVRWKNQRRPRRQLPQQAAALAATGATATTAEPAASHAAIVDAFDDGDWDDDDDDDGTIAPPRRAVAPPPTPAAGPPVDYAGLLHALECDEETAGRREVDDEASRRFAFMETMSRNQRILIAAQASAATSTTDPNRGAVSGSSADASTPGSHPVAAVVQQPRMVPATVMFFAPRFDPKQQAVRRKKRGVTLALFEGTRPSDIVDAVAAALVQLSGVSPADFGVPVDHIDVYLFDVPRQKFFLVPSTAAVLEHPVALSSMASVGSSHSSGGGTGDVSSGGGGGAVRIVLASRDDGPSMELTTQWPLATPPAPAKHETATS